MSSNDKVIKGLENYLNEFADNNVSYSVEEFDMSSIELANNDKIYPQNIYLINKEGLEIHLAHGVTECTEAGEKKIREKMKIEIEKLFSL